MSFFNDPSLSFQNRQNLPFASVLGGLEAAAEVTRLRILLLLAEAELSVRELMNILGQSQPRVSRHLKLLVEAGLVQRHREGAWAFFRLAEGGVAQVVTSGILAALNREDAVLAEDGRRLDQVRKERQTVADAYFARHADNWEQIRKLHVAQSRVEAAIFEILQPKRFDALIDFGTGTGRMLECLTSLAQSAVGIDSSPAMLNAARVRLDQAGMRHIQLRQGDAYYLQPDLVGRFDLAVLHQVLHYLEDPAQAVREAARALRPGGRLLVVDLMPHGDEVLQREHGHRRPGFAQGEMETFFANAHLSPCAYHSLMPEREEKGRLAVGLWLSENTTLQGDFPLSSQEKTIFV